MSHQKPLLPVGEVADSQHDVHSNAPIILSENNSQNVRHQQPTYQPPHYQSQVPQHTTTNTMAASHYAQYGPQPVSHQHSYPYHQPQQPQYQAGVAAAVSQTGPVTRSGSEYDGMWQPVSQSESSTASESVAHTGRSPSYSSAARPDSGALLKGHKNANCLLLLVTLGYFAIAILVTICAFTGGWIVSNEFAAFEKQSFHQIGPFYTCDKKKITSCSPIGECTNYWSAHKCSKFVVPIRALLITVVTAAWLSALTLLFIWYRNRKNVIQSITPIVWVMVVSFCCVLLDLSAWAHWIRFYIVTYVSTSDPDTPVLGWSFGMAVTTTGLFLVGGILLIVVCVWIKRSQRDVEKS
jgi:hypothetical protein